MVWLSAPGHRIYQMGAGSGQQEVTPPASAGGVLLPAASPGSGPQALINAIFAELVPGILAMIALLATAYIAAYLGKPVPDVLSNIDFAIIAFYFGARSKAPIQVQLTG